MDIVGTMGSFHKEVYAFDTERSADYHNNHMLVKSPNP